MKQFIRLGSLEWITRHPFWQGGIFDFLYWEIDKSFLCLDPTHLFLDFHLLKISFAIISGVNFFSSPNYSLQVYRKAVVILILCTTMLLYLLISSIIFYCCCCLVFWIFLRRQACHLWTNTILFLPFLLCTFYFLPLLKKFKFIFR